MLFCFKERCLHFALICITFSYKEYIKEKKEVKNTLSVWLLCSINSNDMIHVISKNEYQQLFHYLVSLV